MRENELGFSSVVQLGFELRELKLRSMCELEFEVG